MSIISETLLKQEQEIDTRFKELIQQSPSQAQAIATLGIYKALNTLVRMMDHANDGLVGDIT